MQQPIFIRFERLLIKIWGKQKIRIPAGGRAHLDNRIPAPYNARQRGREKCLTKKIYRRKMFDEKEIAYLQEMEERITRSMAVLIESDVTPKFNLLADGIKDIQEKLVPRSRVDDLEDEVKFLKLMCRQMAEDIAKLKKAN